MRNAPDAARVRPASTGRRARLAGLAVLLIAAPGVGRVDAGAGPEAWTAWIGWLLVLPALAVGVGLGAWFAARRRRGAISRIAGQAAQIDPGRPDGRLQPVQDRALAPLVDELNRMLGRLEAGLAARDRFTSEVAHELKTPVSVLLLEAQVVARTEPDPTALARFVSSVEEEMRRLSKLIESFLTLARIDAGNAAPLRKAADMNEIALEAGEHCWPAARLRDLGLSVSLDSDDADSPVVEGIPELLRTMIENLLRNAIAVSPRHSNIQLRVTREGSRVAISVRDRGPGVPEALAGRIFERFVSGGNGIGGVHGSGIGLTIAQGIARVHGGDVRFRNMPSTDGGGAEFSARIPLVNGSSTHPPATADRGA